VSAAPGTILLIHFLGQVGWLTRVGLGGRVVVADSLDFYFFFVVFDDVIFSLLVGDCFVVDGVAVVDCRVILVNGTVIIIV
jgi:hypothetical protein